MSNTLKHDIEIPEITELMETIAQHLPSTPEKALVVLMGMIGFIMEKLGIKSINAMGVTAVSDDDDANSTKH